MNYLLSYLTGEALKTVQDVVKTKLFCGNRNVTGAIWG